MGKKKPIVSSLGQWAYPGEVTIIPSNSITMKGVGYPVLGVDNLGNSQMMMPGADYTFPGDYVTEIPQMGKGGLTQWFAEEWTDVKTGKPCGRSGKEKGSRPYPACRPKKRVNETTPKTTSEMSSAEKAKFKREKTSGKRIDYNHKRREDGGETWLDQYQDGGIKNKRKNISDSPNYQYDDKGNLLYTPSVRIEPYAADNSTRGSFSVNPKLVMQNLNPTLEEFINVASPYYSIDNKLVTDPKINLQPSKYQQYLEQEYVLPQMLGRSFGNLPLIKDDGYSPNRRWVSNLRAKDTGSKYSNDSYAYVLKTNPNNLVDYSTKNTIEDNVSSNDKVFYDYLAKNNYLPNTVSQLTKKLPDQIWNTAEQMRVEMLNNPEIMSWANLHNIDLGYKQKGQGDDSFAPKIPESVYANRLVKAGLATNRPDYDYKPMETYIVQDPSKFDLAGYFPMNSIVKDAEQKVLNKKVSDKPKQESIYFGTPEYFEKESYIKNEIAKRLGINPSAFDTGEYLIHYNQSPITEYTPGKKYGGWLEQYQEGGFRYTPPPRRTFTTSYQQPTRSTSDNTRVVTPNVSDATRAMVADQRAREAAAKRSGVIYAGTPESDYEKAKKAASFVEQSKLRDGFATPLDYVLDVVNPATYAFSATDIADNTAKAAYNVSQGEFTAAGSNLLDAGLNTLDFIPVAKGSGKFLKGAVRYGDDVLQTSKMVGKPSLPKYKDVYRAEHAGFNQVATPQDITGRWAANSADEASYYVQNLKDPTTGKVMNAFSGEQVPVRIMKQRVPEYKYNQQFAEGMPEEARIMSMGPGRLSRTELDQVLGPGATKRFETNQFSNQDLAAMQTAPFLFNPNEGILDAGIINNLRQGKNTLSGRASVFATQNQAADYLLNQTKSKQNVSSLNKYLPFNTFQMGGMSIPRVNGTKGKGGQTNWLEQYQEGGEEPAPEDIEKMETIEINSRVGNKQVSKRKTDLDREINTGYNIFDKLKNKANRFILNLVASNPAFAQTLIEGTKIADKAVRKVGDKTKDFIYENYRPIEYPTVRGAIYNLYKGSAPPIVNPEGKLVPGEEAYRLALGLPTEQNYIIPSKYRPTTSTDPNMSYYTMPDVFDQQALINAYMEQSKGQPGQKVQIKALSPFIKNKNKIDSPDIPFEQTDPLQNFQLSQGSDERGNYISLYDIYDFGAPFDQLIYGSNRKPIEFYDRFYYTTNAQGKPVYKKKYGGWLNKYK